MGEVTKKANINIDSLNFGMVEDYRKISYPVITETEHLKNYLIKNSFLFNTDLFLNASNFQGIEIDSWYQ